MYKKEVQRIINSILGVFDIRLVKKSTHEKMRVNEFKFRDYELSNLIEDKYFVNFFENLHQSKAQLRQDLFVLSEFGFKHNGFFVEFGATNGKDLSNTHLLEKKFGWDGILAEPARIWHPELLSNRSVAIETNCAWNKSDEILTFDEVEKAQELSTIDTFSNCDGHKNRRQNTKKYKVKTISLYDMLKKHKAPKEIDYLSIDTEGSEYEILSGFDFNEYDIKVITCEHNYGEIREKIFDLLSANGYMRKLSKFSLWDDWYVRQ